MGATDAFGIYKQVRGNNATEVVTSGNAIRFEAGSTLDLSAAVGILQLATGEISAADLAGDLASGYILVNIFDAKEVVSASGSFGALSTGTNPAMGRVNASVDPTLRIRWSTAAGAQDPLQLPPIAMPNDIATAGGMTLHLYGEKGSAQASADIDVRAYFNLGDVEMGSTVSFTSAPSERTLAIASGDIGTSGMLNLILEPLAHASGPIDLYGAWLTYLRTS